MRTPSKEIDLQILKILKKADHPISTQDIGKDMGKAWHSIQTHCLRLQLDGRINGFRIGRVNVWVRKNE